jgi:hypothetical protein
MALRTDTVKKIYQDAARRIAATKLLFVTSALHQAAGNKELASSLCDRMGLVFDAGWADWSNRERVIALCLMAAMVEAGDA